MTTENDPGAGGESPPAIPQVPPAPAAPAAPAVPQPAPVAAGGAAVPAASGEAAAAAAADVTATAPYPPAAYPPPASGQPAPAGAYGQPPQPDRRPKGLAITALVLAIVGTVLALTGFVPLVGVVTAIVGGVVLAAALVLSIVVLAGRRQGGKGMGIAALIVSVIGGIACVFALVMSLIWFGLIANATGSAPAGIVPTPAATQPGDAAAASTYDEEAFIDAVRPQIRSVFHELEPAATDDQIDAVFSDDTLVLIGKSILASYETLGNDAIGVQADAMVASSDDTLTQDQAEQLVEAFLGAAQDHLVE